MDLYEKIKTIKSKDGFMDFIKDLALDNRTNRSDWNSSCICDYLEGINSWVEDMEGYYENMKMSVPKDIDWSFIATLLYVGKIYE